MFPVCYLQLTSRLTIIITLTLRQSKTDVFGAGVQITLGATNDILCPVTAVLSYLAIRPSSPGPLFVLQSGAPLSRQFLVSRIRQALANSDWDVAKFSGHSFRIGAATTTARAGIPDSTIQLLGRWKSSAFIRYIRPPSSQLASVPRTLARLS